jgi:hypothetical protein
MQRGYTAATRAPTRSFAHTIEVRAGAASIFDGLARRLL